MILARVFRALADPTRRAVLQALRERPLSAGEIAERFPLARSTLSQHLAVLLEAGLVEVEREGRQRVYHLSASVLEEALAYLMALIGGPREIPTRDPGPGG